MKINIKLLYTFFLIKLVSARFAFIPKFFAQDSAVIVDTDKNFKVTPQQHDHRSPQRNLPSHHYRPVQYPVYHIIPRVELLPQKPTQAPRVSISTSTTPTTVYTKDEFPSDLLEIAQNKLGIKTLDEVPSISELGELLGTESAAETIKYIRELTSTEEGIALVKAYIESTDYTDSTGTDTSSISAEAPIKETLNEILPANVPSFFERMSAYLNFFDFFATSATNDDDDNQQIDRLTLQEKKQVEQSAALQNIGRFTTHLQASKPLLVRSPLPYHYPIPIRPVVYYQPRASPASAQPTSHNSLQSVVHLNTPKFMVPQPHTAAGKPFQVTTKSTTTPKQFNHHQQQPQLQEMDDLAATVSKFPLTHDRNALIDAQYAAAIEKAFTEDEDLKKILGSTKTLN